MAGLSVSRDVSRLTEAPDRHWPAPALKAARAFAGWCETFVAQTDERLGRDGAVCPCVATSFARQATRFVQAGSLRRTADVCAALMSALELFEQYDPNQCDSLVVLFPALAEATRSKEPVLRTARLAVRPDFLKRGATCGEFYPGNADASIHNPAFAIADAPVAAVVIRRLAPHDRLFLAAKPDQLALFEAHRDARRRSCR